MPSGASGNTLVCELRFPASLGLLFAGGVAAALGAVLALPAPWWGKGIVASSVCAYALVSGLRWWRRTPARLVITGDGRCRGIARDGSTERYGEIRGGVVRRSYVVVATGGASRRRLIVTAGMVDPPQFRRLRARLRTAVAP